MGNFQSLLMGYIRASVGHALQARALFALAFIDVNSSSSRSREIRISAFLALFRMFRMRADASQLARHDVRLHVVFNKCRVFA